MSAASASDWCRSRRHLYRPLSSTRTCLSILLTVAISACGSSAFLPLFETFLPTDSIRTSLSSLNLNAVTETSLNSRSDDSSDGRDNNKERKKKMLLSRPERKARERANKAAATAAAKRRKHNYAARKDTLTARPSNGQYNLHSNAVSRLAPEHSTADDVVRAIKRAQNLHDAHDLRAIENFLLEQTDERFAYGYRGSLLSRLAVAALHVGSHRLARKAMEERRLHHRSSILPMESAALVRGLLRVHNVTDAIFVLEDELPLPGDEEVALNNPANRNLLTYRARALASVASRHFFEGEPSMAVLACRQLAEMGPLVRIVGLTTEELQIPWARILKGAAQCESGRRDGSVQPCVGVEVDRMPCNVVYAVLDAMSTFPVENNDQVYEILASSLVRRVLFVTGAVDMEGCPPADRGEAAWIGRSNVGKSSCVNMVTNRKSLAYTSKRPGKTQQFNFFAVNDKADREKEIKYGDVVGGEKDADSFYIVDLPGFGYAKVPEKQRQKWANLMRQYIAERKTLRVIFHLIDGRHGPMSEDVSIMKQVGDLLPSHATYVVVLTKTDKNVKRASTRKPGRVSKHVMTNLRAAMKESGVGNAPVIVSSAQTKLGRDDLWRYLRLAAEG